MFRKILDQAQAGDNVGLLLRGIDKEDLERGMVLAKPKSITPHTKFKCEVYVLTKEEGGRHTPFFKGYRPQFYFRTTDVTGMTVMPEGVEMVMPGDNVTMDVELITPIAMSEGLRFAIREGGRTVGAGVVAKILRVGGTIHGRTENSHQASRHTKAPRWTAPRTRSFGPRSAPVPRSADRFRCRRRRRSIRCCGRRTSTRSRASSSSSVFTSGSSTSPVRRRRRSMR